MEQINQIFDRMDMWRHLPAYQLERRADIFFSLYLKQVLKKKTGFQLSKQFIPEFPIRKGTIEPNSKNNQSYNIDYVAISEDGRKAFFIELKTDMGSRNDGQDNYLSQAKNIGMNELLKGIIQIFQATQAKRKYFYLFQQLEELEQLWIPQTMKAIILKNSLRGITNEAKKIKIISQINSIKIIYIQPNGDADNIINFNKFAEIIETNKDPVSIRFAQSLREWAKVEAGQP